MQWYLAAPFFNPVQLALVQSIENAFTDARQAFFSPRLLDENKGGKGKLTAKEARHIFRKDVNGMMSADGILAVLDWKLPGKQELRILDPDVHLPPDGGGPNFVSPPLNLPDSGTVFEMGFQYCRRFLCGIFFQSRAFDPERVCEEAIANLNGKCRDEMMAVLDMVRQFRNAMKSVKTVVFTERSPTASINLMLTQGADGVINGLNSLRSFLGKNGEPDWESLKQWEGEFR